MRNISDNAVNSPGRKVPGESRTMKYKNLYEITFDIKKGGWKKYMIHVEAYNQKEAIQIVKDYWYANYKSHMFSIDSRKVSLDEVIDMKHWFVRVS